MSTEQENSFDRRRKGYLALVLHAHLPFVRHPECEYFLEENWLYEAVTETYIPLLNMFEMLRSDRVPFRMTISITPTLGSMLADEFLQQRYVRHIDKLIELAEKEVARTASKPEFRETAYMYLDKFLTCRRIFVDVYDCNLLTAFRRLQNDGYLEIITCGATHGFFPNMQGSPNSVRAQVQVAIQSHENRFGSPPRGIWLPECGYFPGIERFLDEAGIQYFFLDTHGVLFAEPRPKYGVFAPIYCSGTRVAGFGRDMESSRSVWSSEVGYPGDPSYRDFYRDIGFDLPPEYIGKYIDPIGIRIHTGIKYYKITGKTKHKEPYSRGDALRTAERHASDFMFNREQQVQYLSSIMDRPPVVVAPYDAELFGHWWYEGPEWLNYLIRKTAFEQDTFGLCTPSDYLATYPENQVCAPSFSSWGNRGYSEVWLNENNDWVYRHLHRMERKMVERARRFTEPDDTQRKALNQMARELLLAQSSDWAFIMKTGTMVEYAVRRTKEHISNFNRLLNDLDADSLDPNFIYLLESHNNLFPHIDYQVYA